MMQGSAPVIYEVAMGIHGVTLPPDPIQALPTYETAKAAFEQLLPVRILFDNGAGGKQPGDPRAAYERSFARFPIPGTSARFWFLRSGSALRDGKPTGAGADSFTWDAHARPLTDFTGNTATGGLWASTPDYHWSRNPPGYALSYVSKPLAADTTVIGAGAVHAWVRSSRPNVDLQATITEVRPDGKETFVQNGWVRGNERKLDDAKSTLLEPVLSLREADVSPLPRNKFVRVVIPLYYEGHVYRAGSRIRVRISAPNGDQPVWSFAETQPTGTAAIKIARTGFTPSSLVLPVVPGVNVPTGLPPCPGLRGEPCRSYQAFTNLTAPL
jgi:putative CocE/NonD family hydrolase